MTNSINSTKLDQARAEEIAPLIKNRLPRNYAPLVVKRLARKNITRTTSQVHSAKALRNYDRHIWNELLALAEELEPGVSVNIKTGLH